MKCIPVCSSLTRNPPKQNPKVIREILMPSEENFLKKRKETHCRLNKSVLHTAAFMNPERQSIHYLNHPIYWTAQTGSLYTRQSWQGLTENFAKHSAFSQFCSSHGKFCSLPWITCMYKGLAPVTSFLPQSRTSGVSKSHLCFFRERCCRASWPQASIFTCSDDSTGNITALI